MGAWIETAHFLVQLDVALVAPHVGAWIETRAVILLLLIIN